MGIFLFPGEHKILKESEREEKWLTWEALEDAGIPPSTLSGSDTAVFVGAGTLIVGNVGTMVIFR